MNRIALALLGALILHGAPALAADAAVGIDNFAFTPATITVRRGERVVWTNHDDIPHTVTDATTPPAWRSRPLDTGDSFSMAFDRPGTYRYYCSLHPHMQGTVEVQ